MTYMKAHKAAEIFPMMDDTTYHGLVENIREHGQIEPITVHEGQILDGRNRYRACLEIGKEPWLVPWDGQGTPLSFVISKNLHRRHLNESQRAMIAAKLSEGGKERSLKNLKGNQAGGPEVGIPTSDETLTVNEASDLFNVSRDSIACARKVMAEGTPGEIASVEEGVGRVGTIARKITQANKPTPSNGEHKPVGDKHVRNAIWRDLKAGLEALSNLPAPADVAKIVSQNNRRAETVNQRAVSALAWLKEFEDEWRKYRGDAS